MAEETAQSEEETSFLRTSDYVSLSTSSTGDRVALAAEAFGNRICFLEPTGYRDLPPDISLATFILDQALSVRALAEMIMSGNRDAASSSAIAGGQKTLLYGHAVQLKHVYTGMYLACLATSSSKDKLAFDVGLQETGEGDCAWWMVHPASKQRSEGEKVRVGDDIIMVSVATERYLHISGFIPGQGLETTQVVASFQQTLWTVVPLSSGNIRIKSIGFVFGYDVIRLNHGNMDECLTIPPASQENCTKIVMYETGNVCRTARSLWKIEHIKTKWSNGFISWSVDVRFKHITSGRYLAVLNADADGKGADLVSVHRRQASEEVVVFTLEQTKDDRSRDQQKQQQAEIEGMGPAEIKYGDTTFFIQHKATQLWLSYKTFETKKMGVGKVEEKQAAMLLEGHMDDGLTMSRAQNEEAKSARVIRKCTSLFHRFIAALTNLKSKPGTNVWTRVTLTDVIRCLDDLIDLFSLPPDGDSHEEKQVKLKVLRNRQDLFQEESMISLIIDTIDTISGYKTGSQFAQFYNGGNQGSDNVADKWEIICNSLYLLLAGIIRGNHTNCAEFAQAERMDWLVEKLKSQSSGGVLDVFHYVLVDSPEALNVIRDNHIETIISLIDKTGRTPKILDILCSLCVGNGIAVRANQNQITNTLLPGRDLLLQTSLVDLVTSMRPNVFIGLAKSAPTYKKWYFEVMVDSCTQTTHQPPHLRVGWANTLGYQAYPGPGDKWGANGVGDCLYSWGFDGYRIFSGGTSTLTRRPPKDGPDLHTAVMVKPHNVFEQLTSDLTFTPSKGDVFGCFLDLTVPKISFCINGIRVRGYFRDFNTDGMFFPVLSLSAEVSARFLLGGDNGKLRHPPPADYQPVSEALLPSEPPTIKPICDFGQIQKNVYRGPDDIRMAPLVIGETVDTSDVNALVGYLETLRDRLVV